MTAVAAVLAGTGLVLSGAAAATGQQLTRPALQYTCRFPGWQPVPAQVAVSIPGTATAGQPIRPAVPIITVTLPRADRARLARLNAAKVSLTAQVRGEATGNGTSVADSWLLKTVSATVPARGSLVVQVPGAVQPVTERATGNLTFTAAGLSVLLAPQVKDGTTTTPPSATASPAPSSTASPAASASSPAATTAASQAPSATPSPPSATASPAPVRLACTLNPGQTGTLATVPVVAATAGPATAAPRTANGHFLTGLWQAAPGGNISGTAKKFTLTDATTGTVIACKSSTMSGAIKFGQQLATAGLGSISSVTVLTCTGPGGKTFTVTTSASASHPWLLNAQSWDATTTNTMMTISGIMAGVSGPGCSAIVAGPSPTAPGTAEAINSIDAFSFADTLSAGPSGTLHVWNVSGCSGLFNGGDALTLTVAYTVTPSQWIVPASCPPFPVKAGFPFNPHFKLPPYPHKGALVVHPLPSQGCAFIKGFTNVSKLGGAALVGPGFGNVQVGRRTILNASHNQYFQTDSTGQLYYKPCPGSTPQCKAVAGLPPVTATLLGFGFVPTTATLQITQVGTLNIVSVGTGTTLKFSKVQSLASIRVQKVLVNGAPLNVGNDCHTVKPFLLQLTGKPPYQLDSGGVLSGTVTVPPFTGCGVGENLDPIFNATVSGPGNLAQLTQGTLCAAWNTSGTFPSGCPASVPKPVH